MVGIVKAKNLKENKMLFEIIRDSEESRDASKYLDILHDDFVSISHASGTQMNNTEIKPFIEKIFDQKLSFVDAYANLNRLSLEVFHLHSIYPLLIGLGINNEGVIE